MTTDDRFNLAIIGAGIHGAGVAQAAAARGLRVVVLEQSAVAAGTSGRSSKLIHGGLRYLETGQWRLVRESLRERELLLRLAPGLVRRRYFHLPVYRDTRRRPARIFRGLLFYSLLAGFRPHTGFTLVPRRHWPGLDGLRRQDLRFVFRYTDAQTDDVALTEAVLRSAMSLGAQFRCPAEFNGAERMEDGYVVRYRSADRVGVIKAAAVVNAAGPWLGEVARRFIPSLSGLEIELVQGSHLTLAGSLERGCYYLEAPDDRLVFAMPWRGETLLGTTERPHRGDPRLAHISPDERAYLVDLWRRYFPSRPATITGAFTGLRVLKSAAGAPFLRSRAVGLPVDDESRPRAVTILGGKLSGYRATADKVLRVLAGVLPVAQPRTDTAILPLT